MEKPIIYYVPDLEEYSYSRDFYYPYQEYIYGQIAKNQNELMNLLNETSIDKEKLKVFKEKFLNQCDGNSTKRFVEEIILK